MSYRSSRFNGSMKSVDSLVSPGRSDMSKCRLVSDNGVSVNRMLDALDYDPTTESRADGDYNASLVGAILRLAWLGEDFLAETLLLIVENRSYREVSIRKSSKTTYFRNRQRLLDFFTWDSGAHGYIEGHANCPGRFPAAASEQERERNK